MKDCLTGRKIDMLTNLEIKNIALIEELSIELKEGMTVLTGETGAGKSIIIDSVNLILGARANKGLIRYGEDKARVQALFCVSEGVRERLEAIGIEADDAEVSVLRDITADGRSTCRINGMIIPQATLKAAAELLVNIHGQQDNQSLLNPKQHLGYLDSFAGNDDQRRAYSDEYNKRRMIQKRLDTLIGDERERAERIDLLTYQTDEIIEAALTDGEKAELLTEQSLLQNAERISGAVSEACALLYDEEGINAYDAVSGAESALSRLADIGNADAVIEKVCDVKYAIEDLVHEVRALSDGVEYSQARLDEIEERLNTISRMEKKYGGSERAVLEYLETASNELEELTHGDELTQELTQELEEAEQRLKAAAQNLTETRRKAGVQLSGEIEKELAELDMPKVRFAVSVKPSAFAASGGDEVEFLICPNVGEELKPLAKFASGGELSRVMLAMKSILADADDAETLIFDEIDTGVSGSAAQKIARKMSALSRKKQVICVSHQPQLAVAADSHLLIEKSQHKDRTTTGISELDYDARVREVARIIDGNNPSEAAIIHARTMIDNA